LFCVQTGNFFKISSERKTDKSDKFSRNPINTFIADLQFLFLTEKKTLLRRHIGFDELRRYFYMPITRAAREMNVGLTVHKKRCRELGIARWPHRKIKSLKSLILNVQVTRLSLCTNQAYPCCAR
jgi:hypothetical protein